MFETGIGIRNPLFFVGIVEDAIDPRHENRVRVRAFGIHGTVDDIPSEDLPWAICVAGNYNFNALPLLNEWVFGVFLDGRDAQQPLVLGSIPTVNLDGVNPEVNGYGAYARDNDAASRDGAPSERIGMPRGHPNYVTEDFVEEAVSQASALSSIQIVKASTNLPGEEEMIPISAPTVAISPRYPHNHVISSGYNGPTVEVDSSPGSERFQVSHKGTTVVIDSNGTRIDHNQSDSWELNQRSKTVHIAGASQVHIVGNCNVKIEGNKVEEISGDLIQNVHGNYYLGVGGQHSINAGDEVQMRSAQLRLEANVGGLNIKSAKDLNLESTASVNVKGGAGNINLQCDANMNITVDSASISSSGDVQLSSGGDVKIGGSVIHLDANVRTNNIDANSVEAKTMKTITGTVDPGASPKSPSGPSGKVGAAAPAAGTEMPEPPARRESITSGGTYGMPSRASTVGPTSRDDGIDDSNSSGGVSYPIEGVFGGSSSIFEPLFDVISEAEGTKEGRFAYSKGYNTWYSEIEPEDIPITPLVETSISQVMIEQYALSGTGPYVSSAAGRYQIIRDTLSEIYTPAGLTQSSIFNPTNQDKLAIVLLQRKGLNQWLDGNITDDTFLNSLAETWAGLPLVTGDNVGKSYYDGDAAGNTAYNPPGFIDRLRAALDQVRQNYNSDNSSPEIIEV